MQTGARLLDSPEKSRIVFESISSRSSSDSKPILRLAESAQSFDALRLTFFGSCRRWISSAESARKYFRFCVAFQ